MDLGCETVHANCSSYLPSFRSPLPSPAPNLPPLAPPALPPQHGWQFGGGGAPQEIPQSDPGRPKQTTCASGRACAQVRRVEAAAAVDGCGPAACQEPCLLPGGPRRSLGPPHNTSAPMLPCSRAAPPLPAVLVVALCIPSTSFTLAACTQAFPTAEAHGLVWAWLEPGPAGEAAAAKAPLPTLPAADHRGVEWFHVSTW